ncbi:hypothetical protein [Cytobacillus firmus]|nr:hypothetical protein [Cytobacillus firmus]
MQVFGQHKANRCSRCPNQAHIRTAKAKSQIPLSKSASIRPPTREFPD